MTQDKRKVQKKTFLGMIFIKSLSFISIKNWCFFNIYLSAIRLTPNYHGFSRGFIVVYRKMAIYVINIYFHNRNTEAVKMTAQVPS